MDSDLTSARVVLILFDETVVVTKSDSGTTKFFGGKREAGETMLENAREVLNESGLNLDHMRFRRVSD